MVSPKPQKRFKTSHDNDESDTIQSFPQARVDDESSESSEGSDDDEHLLGPMDLPSAENIHTDLAEELNNLSIRVREDALHDIHGVAYAINETKELVDKSLKDFDQIIQLKKDKKSAQAYELAASISEEYVSSRKRRLMFLRAERFVCKKAANRYFNFFRNKLDLFGEAKLCKDITLDDLDEDDMDCLRAGHHQMVPIRDRSGRLVVSVTHANVKYKHPINLLRTIHYFFMACFEDDESQTKGYVCVNFHGVTPSSPHNATVREIRMLCVSIPCKVAGVQWCQRKSILNPLERAAMNLMFWIGLTKEIRARSRIHYGDPKQCMYAMMTFGIPTDHLPLPPSNRMEEWIEMRRKLESLQKPMLIPSPLDVLLGRGKVVQDHAGNIWFRMLLKRDFPEYERLIKFDKNDHAQRIVQEMRDSGARFLRKDTNGVWEELDDREARVKVSHGFRNLRAAVYKE